MTPSIAPRWSSSFGVLVAASATFLSCQCGSHLASADGLAVSPPALDFGDVVVDTQAVKALTLTNQGGGNLTLESASVSGDANFQPQGFSSSTLGPGDAVQLQIAFTPTSVGPHAGTLTIGTDADQSPNTLVQLSGVGVLEAVDAGPDAGPPDAGPPVADAGGVGCADGTREGYLDQAQYPQIAACAGAWSVPGLGLTSAGIAPACNNQGGNDSSHADGTGCSALDLCAVGWHICQGYQEVAAKTGSAGCADAVPSGTQSPGLFFAVAQHSCTNSVCDDASDSCSISGVAAGVADNDNDVFGCSGASGTNGDLGNGLSSGSGCAPLNSTFACEQSNSLCWNQAMPPIGPWQAEGSNSYNEGDYVTKDGCQNDSCSSGGTSIGPSDEGGVLCCAG